MSTAALVDAVISTLTAHLPAYLPAYLTDGGRATLNVVDWRPSRDLLNREAMPACLVEWAGTVGDPERHGRDQWDVEQAIAVSVFDRGSSYADVQRRLAYWSDAVRDCLLAPAHRLLGGLASAPGATYLGTEPGLYDDQAARTLDGVAVVLSYRVRDVLGPPVVNPPGTGPTVTSTSTVTTVR
jgi:hypothetical protein